jgi:raffinose/stachyose/melibiose transport system substrate-binding protein
MFAKKGLTVLLLLTLLFAVSQTLTAGGGQEGAGEVMEIRFMSPWTAGSTFWDDLNEKIDQFNAAHPNITIEHDALPSADLRTKITVEMAAGNPPHCAWSILSYAREFEKGGQIIDWKPVYDDPKHQEYRQWFDEKVLMASEYKGHVMMAPYEAHCDGLFYNSQLFNQLGLSFPKTFDQFVDLAKKAKAQGLAATVTGGKDIRFAWVASAYLARTGGLENAKALALGDAMDQWDNPAYGFPQAMEKFNQFVKAGGYPDGVLGYSAAEANAFFAAEKKALTYYEGQWRPAEWVVLGGKEFENVLRRGNFPAMPDMPNGDPDIVTGGIIAGLIVASAYPEAEQQAAIEWCKIMSSPDMMVPFLEQGKNLYAGTASWNESGASTVWKQVVEAFRKAPRFIPSMDTFAPPPVDLAIKKTAMPGLITGEFTVAEAVAEVQKAAEDYVKTLE